MQTVVEKLGNGNQVLLKAMTELVEENPEGVDFPSFVSLMLTELRKASE